ncbi:unnamed protein product [Mucor circinelloides]
MSSSLKSIVIAESVLTSHDIREILRAASQKYKIDIVVSGSRYSQWKQVLFNQKFKEGIVNLLCDADDDDESCVTADDASNFDVFLSSVKYSACNRGQRSEEYIASNIENVALDMANNFIGSVVCFDKAVILITSIDVFFHLSEVDDCAYTNKWLDLSVFAKLHIKSEKGNIFSELSIIVDGCVELLAVGGLVAVGGGSAEPFLGSSIKPLNRAKVVDSDLITKKDLCPRAIASGKIGKTVETETHDAGFYPVNPLRVEDHSFITSAPLNMQSNLLRVLAMKQVSPTLLNSMLRTVVDSSMLKKNCKLSVFTGTSFLDLYEAMDTNGKWKAVIGIAKDLEVGNVAFDDSKSNIIANKKLVLELVNRGYLGDLARQNDKICAYFMNKI